MKKYELTGEEKVVYGCTMKQIRAVRDFGNVKAGALGGWIESEANLSHGGNCWVRGNARVCGNARVAGDARVSGDALVAYNAWVADNAWIGDNARVSGNARVYEKAVVDGNCWVTGDADITRWKDIFVVSNFGSELETLTAYRTKDGGIGITHNRFTGTFREFVKDVDHTQRYSQRGREYRALIELLKVRFQLAG